MSWPVNKGVKLILGIICNVTALGLFLVPMRTMWAVASSGSTEDFSVVPYVTTLLNCLNWTFYGLPFVGEGRTLVWTVNGVGAALEAGYVLVFFIFNSARQRLWTSIYTGLVLVVFGLMVAITVAVFSTSEGRSRFVGVVADIVTVAMYASPLEVMRLVVRTRSVKYMPLGLSLLSLSNAIAWTAYSIYVRDLYIGIPNGLGIFLGLGQLLLYLRYRHIEIVSESQRHMLESGGSENGAASSGLQWMVSASSQESEGSGSRGGAGSGSSGGGEVEAQAQGGKVRH